MTLLPPACRILLWAFLCAAPPLQAAGRQVAITIDDLPRGKDGGPRGLQDILALTARLLAPFRENRLPVIGFVIGGNQDGFGPSGLRQVLDLWLDSGADLGNHSFSHLNLNDHSLRQYTADILKGEPILRAALASRGKTLRYYRHPFLHTGATSEVRRKLQEFLDHHGYRVAPVTLDNLDFEYALLYNKPEFHDRVRREYVPYMESITAFFEKRSVEVVGHEIPQILLIHASQLNADLMPDLLAMFRRRGYAIVSLDQALADPEYRLVDGYTGPKGISWIHRWGLAKGMPIVEEPDAPQWVRDAFAAR